MTAPPSNAPARAIRTALSGGGSFRFTVRYEYDTFSHLVRVRRNEAHTDVYWQANTSDAAGHVINEQYGNGVMTSYHYNPASGLVQSITSTGTGMGFVQALTYEWDLAGNLTARHDERVVTLTETFAYDDLNRLDFSTLTSPAFNGTNLDMAYDAAGNITTKSGAGSYYYNSLRPHALTDLVRPDGTTAMFEYDANGNLLVSDGKTVYWTSYNRLTSSVVLAQAGIQVH